MEMKHTIDKSYTTLQWQGPLLKNMSVWDIKFKNFTGSVVIFERSKIKQESITNKNLTLPIYQLLHTTTCEIDLTPLTLQVSYRESIPDATQRSEAELTSQGPLTVE